MTDEPLAERDQACVWHPYTQMLNQPPPMTIVKAKGVYLYTDDGRQILDGISKSSSGFIYRFEHPPLFRFRAPRIGEL